MAKFKITGDTTDARAKIKELRKDIERLEKEAARPKKINVLGGRISGGSSSSIHGVSGRVSGKGMAGSVASGNLVADFIKGLLSTATQYTAGAARVAASLTDMITGCTKFENVVTRLGSKFRDFPQVIEAYQNPGPIALERADRLDALDDERRSHNTQTLGEEFGYSKAFANEAGVRGQAIVDRLQTLLDNATSGNIPTMDKAWAQLAPFGITYDEAQNGNTWQVLMKMLKAYGDAGADGENELAPLMEQIVGRRNMGAIRKVGDGTKVVMLAQLLEHAFNSVIPNTEGILEHAAESEYLRSLMEIQLHYVPQAGEHFITDEARHLQQLEERKTGALGDGRTQLIDAGHSANTIAGDFAEVLVPFMKNLEQEFEDYHIERLPERDRQHLESIRSGKINVDGQHAMPPQLPESLNQLNRSIQDNTNSNRQATQAIQTFTAQPAVFH